MAEKQALQARVRSVLEDPSSQAVARVYADAFLNAAAATGVEGALEEFGSFLDDVLRPNPEFEALLTSDIVNRDEKLRLIDRVVAPHGSELFTNFLRVLSRHDRLSLLPLVLETSRREHERRTGRQRVQVTSAKPLSDSSLEAIRERLKTTFEFEPIIRSETDPSLLGGLVIRIGNTVYDSSLKTRLKSLRERLRERSLHEIQSGRDRFSSPEGD